MSIVMRIYQKFSASHESEFLELERQFAELESSRPDYPKGRRLQPISGAESCNTLIWECEFPDVESALGTLDFFHGDEAHEQLFEKQKAYFQSVRVELYKKLEY